MMAAALTMDTYAAIALWIPHSSSPSPLDSPTTPALLFINGGDTADGGSEHSRDQATKKVECMHPAMAQLTTLEIGVILEEPPACSPLVIKPSFTDN